MTSCWYCGSDLSEGAQYCHTCGHSQSDHHSSPLFGVVDPVTGIWNQKFVDALIGQEANRAVRYHRPLSVLVVELDHAEHVNNELDPAQLNALLRELSDSLGRAIRDTDTLGFLEASRSPHFVIVLPETDQQGATLAADKVDFGKTVKIVDPLTGAVNEAETSPLTIAPARRSCCRSWPPV